MLFACIKLPHLGIDSILRRHPRPDEPLALIEGPTQRETLHDVNAAAAQAGLVPGMRLTAARALLPDVRIVTHRPEQTARWYDFLCAWAYQFSSQVHAGWPDAIALEVKGSFSVIGQWPIFERKLRDGLKQLGFRHQIALAPTAHGARVLAGCVDGTAVFSDEHLRNALGRVPIRQALLPADAGERLHGMGVRSLRALFELPRDGLRRRFGVELLAVRDRLLGEAPELLSYYQPPNVFDLKVELAYEVEAHPALLFAIKRMTADLAAFLVGRDGGVQEFALHLEHADHAPTSVAVGLLGAERDAKLLYEITRSRLEQAQIPAPVIALRLIAANLPAYVPSGRDLFDPRPAAAIGWEQLRERLRARLGSTAVYQVAPHSDPRPERAWQRAPTVTATALPDRPLRPTWLLPHPVPLPEPNPRILAGPERIESGWWDEADQRRDYYILQTRSGQCAWAYSDVGTRGPWMLHGWFA